MKVSLMFEIVENRSSRDTWETVGHGGLGVKTKKEVKKEVLKIFFGGNSLES